MKGEKEKTIRAPNLAICVEMPGLAIPKERGETHVMAMHFFIWWALVGGSKSLAL